MIAALPAVACRMLIEGTIGQLIAALVFLVLYGAGWLHSRREHHA
jgi:hypothetical protein